MNCEFCDTRNRAYPPGFIANDGWWHVCPKCKQMMFKRIHE